MRDKQHTDCMLAYLLHHDGKHSLCGSIGTTHVDSRHQVEALKGGVGHLVPEYGSGIVHDSIKPATQVGEASERTSTAGRWWDCYLPNLSIVRCTTLLTSSSLRTSQPRASTDVCGYCSVISAADSPIVPGSCLDGSTVCSTTSRETWLRKRLVVYSTMWQLLTRAQMDNE